MNKIKMSTKSASKIKSDNPTATSKEPTQTIRILYAGTCPKLTTRGKGDLSYELGVDEPGESHVRISGNVSSGAFSNEWLALARIKSLLDHTAEQKKPFPSIVLESLFDGRSSNNYGYLAAILIAEKVLVVLPTKPVMLNIGAWDAITQKIESLKEQGVSLTDHIAIANIQKAKKRAQLVENMRSARKPKETAPENQSQLQESDRKAVGAVAVSIPSNQQ